MNRFYLVLYVLKLSRGVFFGADLGLRKGETVPAKHILVEAPLLGEENPPSWLPGHVTHRIMRAGP